MKTMTLLLTLLLTIGVQAQTYQLPQVDTAPVFAKGKMTSDSFLDYYLQYPESEYKKGIEGTVTLEYVVDSTGMVSDIKVKNSLSPALDKEALRVASLFPFYTPAKKDGENVAVKILFPVTFSLESGKVLIDTESEDVTIEADEKTEKNPLYVVNGKILQKNTNINPSDIKVIRIVKGKKALDLYGQKAKDGLILIETN